MRHSAAPATLERQSRLSMVKRLDLALFVDRQHNGVGRWIDVEADDVPMSRSLAAKWGSLDSLNCRSRCGCRPCPRQMRCTELMLLRVVLAIAGAVQRVVSPGGACRGNHSVGDLGGQRRNSRRTCFVAQQATDTLAHESVVPAPYGGLRQPHLPHDLRRAATCRRQQHDAGAPDVFLRRSAATAVSCSRSPGLSSTVTPVRIT
jgi:hypothetical protein